MLIVLIYRNGARQVKKLTGTLDKVRGANLNGMRPVKVFTPPGLSEAMIYKLKKLGGMEKCRVDTFF